MTFHSNNLASNIMQLPAKAWYRLRSEGLIGMFVWVTHQIHWRMTESRLGVDTSHSNDASWSRNDGENHCYEAINTKCFEDIISFLDIEPNVDVFMDVGCGKGRAVILAAFKPFKKVYGLERCHELVTIARENVRLVGSRACCPIEIVDGCATETDLPDEVNILFLFNPFSGTVLKSFLEKVKSSLARRPRKLQIAYVLPIADPNELSMINWLQIVSEIPPGYMTMDRCFIYSTRRNNTTFKNGDNDGGE
ncbi:MAG: class I SAM-dependent methyltransferase [Planctomycetota bacterium]